MAALLKQIPRRQVDRRAVARGGRRSSDNRSVKPTVLIVDAHQDGREMVAYYLGSLGLNTVQAATGPEALEKVRHCHVALVELVLPHGSGLGLAAQLRSAGVAVIIYSSWATPAAREAARSGWNPVPA